MRQRSDRLIVQKGQRALSFHGAIADVYEFAADTECVRVVVCVCLSTRVYLSKVSACTPRQRIACLIKCFHARQKVSCTKTQDDGEAPL